MVGKRIKEARLKFGISQEQLGKKVGHTKSNVSKWENGSIVPDINNVKNIAAELGVSVSYLIGEKGAAKTASGKKVFEWKKANFNKYKNIINKKGTYIRISCITTMIILAIVGIALIGVGFTDKTYSYQKTMLFAGFGLLFAVGILFVIYMRIIGEHINFTARLNVHLEVFDDKIKMLDLANNKYDIYYFKDISDIKSASESFGKYSITLTISKDEKLMLFDVDNSVTDFFNSVKGGN